MVPSSHTRFFSKKTESLYPFAAAPHRKRAKIRQSHRPLHRPETTHHTQMYALTGVDCTLLVCVGCAHVLLGFEPNSWDRRGEEPGQAGLEAALLPQPRSPLGTEGCRLQCVGHLGELGRPLGPLFQGCILGSSWYSLLDPSVTSFLPSRSRQPEGIDPLLTSTVPIPNTPRLTRVRLPVWSRRSKTLMLPSPGPESCLIEPQETM